MDIRDSDGGVDYDSGENSDYTADTGSDVDKVEILIEVMLVNVGDVDDGGAGGDDSDGDDGDGDGGDGDGSDDDNPNENENDGECIGGASVMCNWNGARNL